MKASRSPSCRKSAGRGHAAQALNLGLHFSDTYKEKALDAYERLITDVVKGNLTLFMRRDKLGAAWAWIDPIREGWLQSDEPPKPYTAGSWGPAASSALIERDDFCGMERCRAARKGCDEGFVQELGKGGPQSSGG